MNIVFTISVAIIALACACLAAVIITGLAISFWDEVIKGGVKDDGE